MAVVRDEVPPVEARGEQPIEDEDFEAEFDDVEGGFAVVPRRVRGEAWWGPGNSHAEAGDEDAEEDCHC